MADKDDKLAIFDVKGFVHQNDNPANFSVNNLSEYPKILFNTSLGQNPFNFKPKFGEATITKPSEGKKGRETAQEKFAPKGSEPTNAAADPTKKLPDVIKQVDPQAAAQILQNMMSMLNMVNQTSSATSPARIKVTVTDALTGALSILAEKYGFKKVIDIFNVCLSNNGIAKISPEYKDVVVEALAQLIKNAATYGENKLPYSTVPTVIYHNNKNPVPLPIYGFAPDLYIRQYYTPENDPYPGFVQWKGPNGDYIYTVRTANEPPYHTMESAIRTEAEQQMSKDLEPFIIKGILTVDQLNSVLDKNFKSVQNNGLENTLGKNSSINIMSLLQQLLGVAGTIVSSTKGKHLPNSVLNQGSVGQSLEKFSKNIGIIKKMKSDSKMAFNLPSAASSLLGGNLNSALGALGSLGFDASSILSVATLAGNVTGGLSNFIDANAAAIAAGAKPGDKVTVNGQSITVS